MTWNLTKAVELCKIVEGICPEYGCHVALTGGSLYKDGERKDCDILFYRIRQCEEIDIIGLKMALARCGFSFGEEHGWVHKAKFMGDNIDIFFPESYPEICEDYGDQHEHNPQTHSAGKRDSLVPAHCCEEMARSALHDEPYLF